MSTPSRWSSESSMSPRASSPTAPAERTSAPSLARTSAVPPAAPAAVMRISSTSSPPWPSGITSTGRASTSSTCTPMAIALTPATSSLRAAHGAVPALHHRGQDGLQVLVAERPRRAQRGRAPVDRAGPLQQARELQRGRHVGPVHQRSVVGHQGGGLALEGLHHERGQLGCAEGRVGRHPNRSAQGEHRVVHARQLVDHAREGGGHGRVGVHHRAGVEAPVDAQMEAELGGGLELARHQRAVEIHHAHLIGAELGQHRSRRGHGDQVAVARAQVAGRAQDEALGRQRPGGAGQLLSFAGQGGFGHAGSVFPGRPRVRSAGAAGTARRRRDRPCGRRPRSRARRPRRQPPALRSRRVRRARTSRPRRATSCSAGPAATPASPASTRGSTRRRWCCAVARASSRSCRWT